MLVCVWMPFVLTCWSLQEEEPPTPFAYSFNAARSPGANPDRYVESQGDADGVITGSYAYLDPNFKWHKVIHPEKLKLITGSYFGFEPKIRKKTNPK